MAGSRGEAQPGTHDTIPPPGAGTPSEGRTDHEPPPPLGSWKRLYALVLLNLAAMIALFYLFTRWFE